MDARVVPGSRVRASSGVRRGAITGRRPAPVEKTRKNRWRLECAGAQALVVRYRVYGREMTVRTNFICNEFALLNGAPTFLTVADTPKRPHEVRIELPDCWRESVTQLPACGPCAPSLSRGRLRGPCGRPHRARQPRTVRLPRGRPAARACEHRRERHLGRTALRRDLEAIVREQIAFWGGAPYDRYVFLNLITEAAGGLEHLASTVLMTSRWKSRTRKGYLEWLGLASHELFHAWNVKRLRPMELGPFDYEAENHTRGLWVAEGITDVLWRPRRPPCRTVDEARVPGPALGPDSGTADGTRPSRSEPGGRLVRRLD